MRFYWRIIILRKNSDYPNAYWKYICYWTVGLRPKFSCKKFCWWMNLLLNDFNHKKCKIPIRVPLLVENILMSMNTIWLLPFKPKNRTNCDLKLYSGNFQCCKLMFFLVDDVFHRGNQKWYGAVEQH